MQDALGFIENDSIVIISPDIYDNEIIDDENMKAIAGKLEVSINII